MIATLLLIFAFLLFSGLPIFLTFGITALVMLTFFSPIPVLMVPEVMYNSLGGFTLLAIPFFTLTAQFMLKGGSSRYLINLANCLVGHWWGGLAIVCVISGMFFGAICGSSVASAIALAVILVTAMTNGGYPSSFAAGVVAASGTLAIMIPPSITMVLYGILTDQSIPRLFFGGVIPGIIQGTLYILWIYFFSKRHGYKGTQEATGKETMAVALKAVPALTLPVIIMGGIYTGFVTVTEASALAAGAAMILAVFIYREVKLREVLPVFAEGLKSAGMIMIIIATAMVFGQWITHAGIPADLVSFVRDIQLPAWAFLIFVTIMLTILGMFLEVASILFITIPILFPMVQELGIDPIHFGIFIVANMELALITPPVGLNLYVLSGTSEVPLNEVIKGSFPFMIIGLVLIFMLAYIPQLVLFLPNLLMAK